MNSPGQKFVDDFDSEELKPLAPVFLKGAHIVYAHSVLQRQCGLGYTSKWAGDRFKSVAEKNRFYEQFGRSLDPQYEDDLSGFSDNANPKEITDKIRNC
jgi:hypothetical protein